MKIKILSLAILSGLTALIYSGINRNQSDVAEASYQVRENNSNSASAQGAVEYWKSIRGSVENGEVKEEDYNRVIAQIENKRASRAGGIGLEFEPIGPTNIGGRTRGLVVDMDDPEIIIAASVTGDDQFRYRKNIDYKLLNTRSRWGRLFSYWSSLF
jgi:hypothetical protein